MLRKISDIAPTKNLGDEKRRCEDPSHDPPSMITLDPGVWEQLQAQNSIHRTRRDSLR